MLSDSPSSVFDAKFTVSVLKSKCVFHPNVKDALSVLRQFLATESPFKMMKNAFYFTSKALFILKIFKFRLDFLDFLFLS